MSLLQELSIFREEIGVRELIESREIVDRNDFIYYHANVFILDKFKMDKELIEQRRNNRLTKYSIDHPPIDGQNMSRHEFILALERERDQEYEFEFQREWERERIEIDKVDFLIATIETDIYLHDKQIDDDGIINEKIGNEQ